MYSLLGVGWLVIAVGGFAVVAYAAAAKFLEGRPASVRLTGTLLGTVWVMIALFFALSVVGMFRAIPVLVLSVAAAVAMLFAAERRQLLLVSVRGDLSSVRSFWVGMSWAARIVVIVLGVALAAFILAPGMASPGRSWDDLVYHLFKAGTWVHEGRFFSAPAPNSWNYYDYYAASGEVVYSWFMLFGRDGAYMGLASGFVWVTIGFGSVAAARQLGANRNQSVVAAAAILTVPAVMFFADSAMVDNVELAAFLLGFVMLMECRRRFDWITSGLALVGLFFAAGAKQSGAPVVVGGVVWVAFYAWRARGNLGIGRQLLRLGAVFLLASVVAAPWYVRSLVDHGNPLYPLSLDLPGFHLKGNPQLDVAIGAEAKAQIQNESAISRAVGDLVDAAKLLGKDTDLNFNYPPYPVVYLVLAVVAGGFALWKRKIIGPMLFLGFTVALALQVMISKNTVALRTIWAPYLGRLMLPAFAAVVLLAATLPWWKWVRPIWYVLPALQLRLSVNFLRRAGTDAGHLAIAQWLWNGLGFVAVAAAMVVAAVLVKNQRLRYGFVAVAVFCLFAFTGIPLLDARNDYRYDQYRQLAALQPGLFHQTPTKCLVDLWQAADRPEGSVIAIAAGTRFATNLTTFRYPFLGSNLQNDLVYIPVSTDGSIVNSDTPPSPGTQLNERLWLKRLAEAKVDELVIVPGNPPEAGFVKNHPEMFEPIATGCDGAAILKVKVPSA